MRRIEVVRGSELKPGTSTLGVRRERAFEFKGLVVSRSRVAGGVASSWHLHGARHLYGLLVSGSLRLDCGPRGGESVELTSRDFFHVPPGLVHRDVNVEHDHELVIVNVLARKRTPVVNLPGLGI